MRNILTVLLLLIALPQQAAAQMQKVLLPVILEKPVPGAFGSLWSSEVTVYNGGNTPLGVGGIYLCHLGTTCAPSEALSPKTTYFTQIPSGTFQVIPSGDVVGKFLSVQASSLQDLSVNLRVVDLSRAATDRGTDIPTVRESAAARATVELLAVPSVAPYRSLLRLYDFDPGPGHSVLVKVFSFDGLIDQRSIIFRQPADRTQFPGYAELDLSYLAPPVGEVRVEVAPSTDGLRFWAMASTTNNDTQHVTITTP
jgi:hypothetical protein